MTAEPPTTRAAEPAADELAAFYDRTSGAAYGLALRVTGDAAQAACACAAAYAALGARLAGDADRARASRQLLEAVRQEALRRRPPAHATAAALSSYARGEAVRGALDGLEPLARRAIELAYFGGLGVDEIAGLLGEPATEVRRALRAGLLALGAAIQDEKGARP